MKKQYNHWEKKFVAELQKREQLFLMGKTKIFTIEEAVARAKNAIIKIEIKHAGGC